MIRRCTLFIALSLFSLTTLSAPAHGEVHEIGNSIEVWHRVESGRDSPDEIFVIKIKRLKGPTYCTAGDCPPYETVHGWDTLINRLPDGRECPMVFFHARWRRLPDVPAVDEHRRNHGNCRDVFRF